MAWEYTDLEKELVTSCSMERLINTTRKCLDMINENKLPEYESELVTVSRDDWSTLQQLIEKVWNEKRDQIFREANNMLDHQS